MKEKNQLQSLTQCLIKSLNPKSLSLLLHEQFQIVAITKQDNPWPIGKGRKLRSKRSLEILMILKRPFCHAPFIWIKTWINKFYLKLEPGTVSRAAILQM